MVKQNRTKHEPYMNRFLRVTSTGKQPRSHAFSRLWHQIQVFNFGWPTRSSVLCVTGFTSLS